MLTLVDHETPLWLDKALMSDIITENLRFHTGVMLTQETTAPFAVVGISSSIDLSLFATGDVLSPEKSTTVIVEVTGLQGGIPLQFSGPGLEKRRQVAPQLSADLLQYRCQHNGEFPAGLDLMFTCGDALMVLPRTTHVEVC